MGNRTTKLKKILQEKNITYKVFANLVGVCELSIIRYANGEREPAMYIIQRMVDILGIPLNEGFELFSVIDY